MKKVIVFGAFVASLFFGCKESTVAPDPDAFGLDYYPLTVGDYRIYHVTNIIFKNNIGDTTRFQLKERVDTTFIDQTGQVNYKIIRSTRPGENAVWQDDSVMVVVKTNSSVILTKDNTKRVKLVFPVKEGKVWSADAFNSNQVNYEKDRKEKYSFTKVGETFQINGHTFNNTVTVIQGKPTENLVQLDDRKEVYAKEIGMIYRLFNRVVFCNDSEAEHCEFGVGYKLNGHERHEELVAYGNE